MNTENQDNKVQVATVEFMGLSDHAEVILKYAQRTYINLVFWITQRGEQHFTLHMVSRYEGHLIGAETVDKVRSLTFTVLDVIRVVEEVYERKN